MDQKEADEKLDEIVSMAPGIFEDVRCGIGLPAGWLGILRELVKSVADLPEASTMKIVQVKEKFGTLRVYYEGTDSQRVRWLVAGAENSSASTCRMCGKPRYVRRSTAWFQAVCSECNDLREIDRVGFFDRIVTVQR